MVYNTLQILRTPQNNYKVTNLDYKKRYYLNEISEILEKSKEITDYEICSYGLIDQINRIALVIPDNKTKNTKEEYKKKFVNYLNKDKKDTITKLTIYEEGHKRIKRHRGKLFFATALTVVSGLIIIMGPAPIYLAAGASGACLSKIVTDKALRKIDKHKKNHIDQEYKKISTINNITEKIKSGETILDVEYLKLR